MLRKITQASLSTQNRRLIHISTPLLNTKKPQHTSESYNKDVDPSPPSDSKIHRVDPSSDTVQKPHEPPSGEWSRAGTKTSEYQSVSKTEPYTAPGEDGGYGNMETSPEVGTSKSGSGPAGDDARGRKA